MSTLKDLIESLQTIKNPETITIPFVFQDLQEENYALALEYNALLAEGKFSEALDLREANPVLNDSIIDVGKFNELQGFILDAYFYAKDMKQQCIISVDQPEDQTEGDFWFKITTEKNGTYMTVPYIKQSDGTYKQFSLTDQEPIKDLQERVNKIERVKEYTLSASGWGTGTPHIQTLIDADLSSTDAPSISLKFENGDTLEKINAKQKAFGFIQRVVTNDGMISFYCYDKVPEIDIVVVAKGA